MTERELLADFPELRQCRIAIGGRLCSQLLQQRLGVDPLLSDTAKVAQLVESTLEWNGPGLLAKRVREPFSDRNGDRGWVALSKRDMAHHQGTDVIHARPPARGKLQMRFDSRPVLLQWQLLRIRMNHQVPPTDVQRQRRFGMLVTEHLVGVEKTQLQRLRLLHHGFQLGSIQCRHDGNLRIKFRFIGGYQSSRQAGVAADQVAIDNTVFRQRAVEIQLFQTLAEDNPDVLAVGPSGRLVERRVGEDLGPIPDLDRHVVQITATR